MKVYQMDGKPSDLYFTNYGRIDEGELFKKIMKRLESNQDIKIGDKQTGPSEDVYECTFSGMPFTLYYDIDYGTSVHCNSPETMIILIEYFG